MSTPQLIPLKRGKECLAVQSWRDSPSVRPSNPATTIPQSPTPNSDDRKVVKRKTKSKPGQQEDNFDDYILKCVIPGVSQTEIEAFLASGDAKPHRVLDIGNPRAVPLKRFEMDAECAKDSFDDNDDGSLPPMVLPPSAPSSVLENGHLICLMFAENEIAQKASSLLSKKWTQSVTEIFSRRRASLNASLVIKGLPFTTQCERLVEELEKLTYKPSYVRLHRGERGVFKCVVFVKYANRMVAEHSKLELERLVVGSKPLKVEFKKKSRDEGQKSSSMASLEQVVRDLRVSKENEGFFYTRSQLSKEEVKYLRQLALSYDLLFESNSENITVKRKLPGDKPSPALRPSGATPQWVPATPGSLLPMDFRGIRHWKEMRQSTASSMLGIVRPLGPGDVPPFAKGRGRPI